MLLLAFAFGRASAAEGPLARLELAEAQAAIAVDGAVESRTVALPYHWDRTHPGQRGIALFRVGFVLHSLPGEPLGLYIPRLGNAYELSLNGTVLEVRGDLASFDGPDYAKQPRYLTIAPDLLKRENLLEIRVRADVGRRGGLSRIHLGAPQLVEPLYRSDHFWRVTGSIGVTVFSLLAGIAAMALWATQVDATPPGPPRRDPLYLYAGLAELFWAVRIADVLIEEPPVAWPWWGILQAAALGFWAWSMALFCMEIAGWREARAASWFRGWLALLVAASFAASATALGQGWPPALTAWYAAMAATFLVFGGLFLAHMLRGGAPFSHRVVALAILVTVAVGIRDVYVFRVSSSYGDNTLIRYAALLFGLGLAYIVLVRFREAVAQARDLMRTLTTRIADREAELARSYAEMEAMARERALAEERGRILRDMHDGVGAHLSTAIRQLESGLAQPQEMLQTLRDSMDQLKLSIDAMTMSAGDVEALLASLRYRLEPRLRSAGIDLQWAVGPLPILPAVDIPKMRQLQFVLYEALSNVLQHAGASILRIEAGETPEGVTLRIVDDGRGFGPDVRPANGFRSMRDRCAAIGARLACRSEAGRTEVEIAIARP